MCEIKNYALISLCLFCGVLMVLGVLLYVQPATADPPIPGGVGDSVSKIEARSDEGDYYQYLPLVTTNGTPPLPTSNLCRLGYAGTTSSLKDYPAHLVEPLRAEWLINFHVNEWDLLADGMRLGPTVWIKQWKEEGGQPVLTDHDAPYAEPYTYYVSPPIDALQRFAQAHPGQVWMLGNEIERRDWAWYKSDGSYGGSLGQSEILPEVYARAYHEVYHAIKAADPTARIANGSVIFPTPLRLEYYTRMWDEYYRLYHSDMPVDVWQIHLYVLPEKRNANGADIPAGIDDVDEGWFIYDTITETILANKDFSHVPGLVRDFRQWLKDRGQQNKPLFITEMAVTYPEWVPEGDFSPEAVRDDYMYPVLDMVFHDTDYDLGMPDDDYRLVQSVWWWSFNMDFGYYNADGEFRQAYNGNLVWSGLGPPKNAPNPVGLSTLGQYWVEYVSQINAKPNLRPYAIKTTGAHADSGSPITATVQLQILNNSEVAATRPFTVTFRDADTGQLVEEVVVSQVVEGCGDKTTIPVIAWPNLAPGMHKLRVNVDSGRSVVEQDETDNKAVFSFFVGGYRLNLPMVVRR
ncbi:MAG: hypothetical protein P1S60_16715 [Anaerolineae bacterium]|nr:hypothetical protein [Anaerolineae bacterium]